MVGYGHHSEELASQLADREGYLFNQFELRETADISSRCSSHSKDESGWLEHLLQTSFPSSSWLQRTSLLIHHCV